MSWGSYMIGFGCGFIAAAVVSAALVIRFFGPIFEGLSDTAESMWGRR